MKINLEKKIYCHIYVDCDIEMLFHDKDTGEEITITYEDYMSHRMTNKGLTIFYSRQDYENDPYTYVVTETKEEVDAIVNEAKKQYKDVMNNWTAVRKENNHKG